MGRALQEGIIGSIIAVEVEDGARYAWTPVTSAAFDHENGGVLADMGVHYLDLVEHLVGRLKPRTYRDDYAGGVEANACIELETETGIPVRIALSRTRELNNRLVLRGTRGVLTAFNNQFASCLCNSNTGLQSRLTAEQPFVGNWPPTLVSCFAQKISNFLTAVRERGAPDISAREVASTIANIEWAYAQRRPQLTVSLFTARSGARPALPPGRAIVTGGTGFIGSHLVGRLTELGFEEISVPIRRIRTSAEVARYPVSLEHVNLLDGGCVRDAVEGARWVFHFAYGRDGPDSDRVTVDGTRNVVEAAIAARSECVVVLSTIYVFGDSDNLVDERHPYRPKGGRYGTDKAAMERWCLARSATSSTTRIVILNPSCVFGPGGHTYIELPHQLAKMGAFCWIEGGRGIANFCFVDNLVDAILLAAVTAKAQGQRFIINDGSCTWREFLAPFVGGTPDRWQSLTACKLSDLHRAALPRWSEALRAVVADRCLRDVLKARMPTSAVIALARRICPEFLKRVVSASTPELVSAEPMPPFKLPPIWLSDLFGPTRTRFSSAQAAAVLGWRPAVKLTQAQDITARWLTGGEFGALRNDGRLFHHALMECHPMDERDAQREQRLAGWNVSNQM
jgi:nucleoside-diphosphate-sugar epimerase